MSNASCPSCNAPTPPWAESCARCGYRFVEGGQERARLPGRGVALATGAAAAVAAALLTAGLVAGGDRDGSPAVVERRAEQLDTTHRLEVVSGRPLATRAAERRLEERFTTPLRDHDTASVSCSEREARPAHSLRRCLVRYPTGMERTVVLLTNASGTEVLSER